MTITSGDVMTRVPVRLSRLAFYCGKVTGFSTLHCVSINLLFSSHFNNFFTVKQASLKIKYSFVKINSEMIVSLLFVQKI